MLMTLFLVALFGVTQGEPQCPSPAEVQNYNASLDGYLVQPGDPDYKEATQMLMNVFFDSRFSFVTYAMSVGDVQKFVKFTRMFDLRPTIRSSGHDYIGRSAGTNTYQISFQKYKESTINNNDPDSDTGVSMTMTTGNTFKELYEQAHNEGGYLIVGGSAHTVTPGGYLLGGGHSPMTPMLGLGVDSVLHITMVTVDGDVMEINKTGYTLIKKNGIGKWTADPEVFWALCGGGGGVFGYVVKYRIKLHRPPSDGFVNAMIHFPMVHPVYGDISEQVLTKFTQFILSLSNKWGGFMITDNWAPEYGKLKLRGKLQLFLLHFGGDMDEVNKVIQPLFNWKPEWTLSNFTKAYPTFWDYEKTITDRLRLNVYIVNRLLHIEDFQENNKIVKMHQASLSIPYNQVSGCTGTLLGGNHMNATYSSVTPHLRTAKMSLTCGTIWEKDKDTKHVIKLYQKYAKGYIYPLGQGVYYNEPDYFLENWKTEYWGSMNRYNRLLAMKKKLDPTNVLCCRHCVGSDLVRCDTPCPNAAVQSSMMSYTLLLLYFFGSTLLGHALG